MGQEPQIANEAGKYALWLIPVGMGNAGAALSVSICDWVEVTVLGLYIKFSPSCEKTRAPPSWEAFRGIGSFMRLAVPSALMICLEWWSYELLVLLSGMLPNPALETSVLSICVSTMILLANLPYGIGIATSVRISNELGAGNTQGPRL
uniref:Protein TRANSPARENT TESTA 12 n=1 Tax=Aegilops tauschii subsp. strangulata TaxID=200361 RepID=A0A452XJ12_AEGTS